MTLTLFIQQLLNGLSLGSMYALIAIGYTMVYGVLRLINFAHGDVMMLGAYACFFAMSAFAFPFIPALAFALIVCVIIGVLIERIAYRPLRSAPRISLLITAIGVSFFLENLINVLFTSTPKAFNPPAWLVANLEGFGLKISALTLISIALIIIVLAFVLYILYRTKYGIAIRALAFDVQTVALMGIDSSKVIAFVFVLGSALASLGGVFWAAKFPSIDPNLGVLVGLKAFGAAVLGGIGSVSGAVLGGLIIGFCEVMMVAIWPDLAGFKDGFAFIFLIFVLLFKPTGIMGKEVGRF